MFTRTGYTGSHQKLRGLDLRIKIGILGPLALFFTGISVSAATLTVPFSGNFAFDNDVVLFDVFVKAPAQLVVYSTSYASGGFQPHLELFDATGTTQFTLSNGGAPACVPTGPAPLRPPGICGDAAIQEGATVADALSIGHYIVALSQADNLSDGFDVHNPFTHDGVAGRNYTAAPGICDNFFCDSFFLTPNTSDWALTFQFNTQTGSALGTVDEIAAVPEPATGVLIIGSLGILAAVRFAKQLGSR